MRKQFLYFLCFLFVVFSFVPTFYELYQRDRIQPNRAFELVHNFPTDYNFYLSRIRQGIEGRTTILEKYTSEPHAGSLVHIFYLFLGWIGRWTRVPWERASDVYHAVRFVLAVTLLFCIASFVKRSFSKPSRIVVAFLLVVTASTWPKLVFYNGGWRFGGYMPWWSVMDSLQRISFIPHLLLGQALIVFLLMAIFDRQTMQKPGNWIFLGLLGFILGIVFPPGLLFVYATLSVGSILEVTQEVRKGERRISRLFLQILLPRGVVLLLSAPSLLYLNLMLSFYPWKRLAEFDIVKPLPFDYAEYIKAVGPMLPLGLIGLLLAVVKRERKLLPSVSWVIAWGALLVVFHFIPAQSPLRFSEMIPHVPLGILTAYLFWILNQWRAQVARKNFDTSPVSLAEGSHISNRQNIRSQSGAIQNFSGSPRTSRILFIIYHLSFIIPVALILLGGGVMYSSWLWQKDFIDHKMSAAYPLVPTGSYVMYPLKDFLRAMKYLQDHTTRDTIILSETTAGNYIPVYSGNTVFVGHANTVNAEAKEKIVKDFFSGAMKPVDALAWMRKNNLHWIFFGPQEMEDGGAQLSTVYPYLEVIYNNRYVTIYRVKD